MITLHDIQAAVSCLHDAKIYAGDYLSNISEVLESIKEIRRHNDITGDDLIRELVVTLSRYSDKAAFQSVLINNTTNRLATICDFIPGVSGVSSDIKDKLGVEIYIGNSMLCVKTPTLFSRNKMARDNRFGERVAELIIGRSKSLPEIDDKCILVFNVYGTMYPRLFRIDPDNVDSKNIVDKISLFYGGDNGHNTTYICMEHTTDEIPQATYTLCMSKEDTELDADKLTAAIKNLMAADDAAKV